MSSFFVQIYSQTPFTPQIVFKQDIYLYSQNKGPFTTAELEGMFREVNPCHDSPNSA